MYHQSVILFLFTFITKIYVCIRKIAVRYNNILVFEIYNNIIKINDFLLNLNILNK